METTASQLMDDAFEKLITHSPVGIFFLKGKQVIMVNPGLQKITDFSEAELMAMGPLGLVVPEYREEIREKAIRMLKGETEIPYEFPFVTKSGERRWGMASVVSTTYQGERATLGYFMDITPHKVAEEALRESERKYRELVENANSIILRWTRDGMITFMNEYGQKFFGYTEEEIIGRHVIGTIVPATESTGRNLEALIRDICADPKKYEYNVNENMRRNGERVWIAWANKVIWDSQGEIKEILSIGSDITERKQAEEALREREATLQGVLRTVPVGLGLAYDRVIAWVNEQMANITGYSAEELKGQSAQMLYDSEAEFERVGQMKYEDISAAGVGSRLTRWRRRDGQVRDIWLSYSALDPQNVSAGVVFAAMDITEHKKAEDKLRQRTAELVALNTLAHQVGASLSLEEVVAAALDRSVYPGRPAAAMLYVRENDGLRLAGAKVDDWGPHGAEELQRVGEFLCSLAFQEGRAVYVSQLGAESRCLEMLGGALLSGAFAALPLLSGEQVLGVLGLGWSTAQEVEAQGSFLEAAAGEVAMGLHKTLLYRELQQHAKELDRRVEERTAQLREVNKELESFAYSISHDLRAPLRAVSGFAQIIARRHRQALNEEGRHYVDNIVQAAERMGHLIDDLLTYSRLGRQGLNLITLSLGDVWSQVLHHLGDRVRSMGAVIELPEEWPQIRGDHTLLWQIFTNLLDNALTYRQPEKVPQVSVTWRPENREIVVAVSDNGLGIAPAYHQKIFNVFQRLHNDEEYPGTGIGLAIVKRAVELMRGRVWLESEEGQGSTFYVSLPKE